MASRFPRTGLHIGGRTIDEAIREAADALSGHLTMLKSDGDIVPPRTVDAILSDPDLAGDREGATLALVPLIENRGTKFASNLSIDSGLLDAIDAVAKNRGLTRSAFLANARSAKSSGTISLYSGQTNSVSA